MQPSVPETKLCLSFKLFLMQILRKNIHVAKLNILFHEV